MHTVAGRNARYDCFIAGIQQGLQQGLAQGDKDRAVRVAREMLADGMSVDKISKYTELSVEEIEALRA